MHTDKVVRQNHQHLFPSGRRGFCECEQSLQDLSESLILRERRDVSTHVTCVVFIKNTNKLRTSADRLGLC